MTSGVVSKYVSGGGRVLEPQQRTLKQTPSKLEEALWHWGDMFWESLRENASFQCGIFSPQRGLCGLLLCVAGRRVWSYTGSIAQIAHDCSSHFKAQEQNWVLLRARLK